MEIFLNFFALFNVFLIYLSTSLDENGRFDWTSKDNTVFQICDVNCARTGNSNQILTYYKAFHHKQQHPANNPLRFEFECHAIETKNVIR